MRDPSIVFLFALAVVGLISGCDRQLVHQVADEVTATSAAHASADIDTHQQEKFHGL